MSDEPKLPPGYKSWFHDSIGGWVFWREATQPGVELGDSNMVFANDCHGENGYRYGSEHLCIEAAIKTQQKFEENPRYVTERMNEVHKKELQEVQEAVDELSEQDPTPTVKLQLASLDARVTEFLGLIDYYAQIVKWDAAKEEKVAADAKARKANPLHGYTTEAAHVPEHDGPTVCVVMVEDTLFREECLEVYRRHEAEGKSPSYCDDCVADRLDELKTEWASKQDGRMGRARGNDAYETTVGVIAPDNDTARRWLGVIFKKDRDRWLNMAGWPRFIFYNDAPRTPF